MSRLVVGPFNRVEGDLEVTLEVAAGRVRSARVNSPLYRGFEQILRGKDPMDALVFAPRICGICSVSQSVAAASALANLMKLEPPENGRLATNLILAAENLADHFTHFYLFFMPDFARDVYRHRPWFTAVQARFKAIEGSAAGDALPARAKLLSLMGSMAGKWPHTLSIQPGGSARPVEGGEKIRLYSILREFRRSLEKTLFGDALEAVAGLESARDLEGWMAARAPDASDFRLFLEIAQDLALEKLGRATDRFLSYGTYSQGDGFMFRRGVWDGEFKPLDVDAITEDISHSWMAGPAKPQPPAHGVTQPLAEKPQAYSWCKAPRLNGDVAETGALARQVVNGHPLIRDLVAQSGGNVRNRVIARLLELALVVPAMESWVRALEPGAPFCHHAPVPEEGCGVGLTESARGSLGHWLEVRRGRIHNYQIISPTTWNFSPRDAQGVPGPLEQALVGAPVQEGETVPVAVQHVVRSFDPCMVCTVH
ncbi:nickel-dependent hydrogenase large subunit [Pelomicrobium methylotrophicum]|uniref:Nickel-dependent hydrogenase large subunit n=1 Tax=Pelomicrobium methylotrophicum TaxID=2602750 RepID=A0A5C7ELY3_9PROT|nr:nickel-dependent hydrogenase large subunit [Pelomicrobium methylotrophicum]TXF12423.1 nickel-dependent hydrogenase large subunit [Pelomicrobium methylotrophicum]